MPCQVAGLKKYLSQEYDNLLTVDLVCHGVPSSQLWEKHLEDLKVKYKSDVESINFRSKIYGYQCGAMKIDFKNQKKYIASSRIDPYMKSFLKNISLRESCYVCKFKTINHNSDLTLFDCWYPEELISNPKNDGYTSIIVQTDKGRHLINQLDKKLFLYNVDLKKMLPVNGGAIVKSALRNSYRDNFYKNVETKDINYAVNQCYKITKSDFIVEKMKGILQKLHVLELTIKLKIFVKKMRRRKFKNV